MIAYLHVAGRFAQGIELGLEAMAWLGRPLPKTPEEQQALLGALIAEIEPAVERMTVEDWKALPMSTDRAHALRCRILEVLATCAVFGMPSLSRCCRPMIVLETLRHGLTKSSFAGCAGTALLLSYALGKVPLGRRLNEAMLALIDQYDVSRAARALRRHSGRPVLDAAFEDGGAVRAREAHRRRGARSVHEAYSELCGVMFQLIAGADLDRVARDLDRMAFRDLAATACRNIARPLGRRALAGPGRARRRADAR